MTADTKQWGAEIAVNGVRPAWLGDGVEVRWSHVFIGSGETVAQKLAWTSIRYIRLPADHFAYKALDKGFVPWGGGDKAPEDWDGKGVLFRAGSRLTGVTADWRHTGSPADIIGYHKRTDAAPDRDPALWDRMVGAIKRGHEFLLAEHAAQGVAAGNDLHIDDDQFEHVIRPMLDALAEVVAELAPPVDPDLMEAREIALANSLPGFEGITSWKTRDGAADDKAFMKAILAGIKRGRQLAGEAA